MHEEYLLKSGIFRKVAFQQPASSPNISLFHRRLSYILLVQIN